MVEESNSQDNDRIYTVNKKVIALIIATAVLGLIIGFGFNFSVSDKITSLLTTAIKGNKSCPANFKKLTISYLLPEIEISGLDISKRCLNSNKSLEINNVSISPGFPSISPLGIGLNTEIRDRYSNIDILTVIGLGSQEVLIESKQLSAKTLDPLLNKIKLNGMFEVDSKMTFKSKKLNKMNLLIKSKNLTIPSQSLNGLDVPNLKIGNFLLKASSSNGKKVDIKEMIVGTNTSPIRAKITGDVTLSKFNVSNSKLNLIVNIKFSSTFMESFSILSLFLDTSKQDAQGFYKIKIGGTIARPSKPIFL